MLGYDNDIQGIIQIIRGIVLAGMLYLILSHYWGCANE
jgi:hypothetical protein